MSRMPDDLKTSRFAGLDRVVLANLEETSMSDDELLVGEQTALNTFFDVANARRLSLTVIGLTLVSAIYAIVMFASGSMTRGVIAGLVVVADLFFLRYRLTPVIARNLRQAVAAVLIGHLVLFQLFHGSADGGIGFWFFAFPILAVRFRLASGETVALFGSLYAVVAVRLSRSLSTIRQPPTR